MGKTEELLDLIREIARRSPLNHATAQEIFEKARTRRIVGTSYMEANKLRRMMFFLEKEGKISKSPNQNFAWIPQAWSPSVKTEKDAEITDAKVMHAMREFFKGRSVFPTPAQICDKFEEIYGGVNSESLARIIRFMYGRGVLKRTDSNEYYFDGMTEEGSTLKAFGV